MPAKKFSSQIISTTQWTQIAYGEPNTDSTVSIHVSNLNNYDIKVNVALTSTVPVSALPNSDIIELDQIVYSRDTRIFPGIVLPENSYLAIKSDNTNFIVVVFGFEEPK